MNWKFVKLGDLCNIQNGYAFDSKKFSSDKGMPLIRIRDLKDGYNTKTCFTGEYQKKYIVHSGDFLISMDGEFQCHQWKGSDALLNQRVCRLENFSKELNPKFLFYIINKELKLIEDKTGFITVKHLSSETIKRIQIYLPPIEEQQRIVAKLDIILAEINKTKNLIKSKKVKLDELKSQMLSKIYTSNKWNRFKLGEICTIYNGGTPKSNVEDYWGGKIKWLTPKDMGKKVGKYINDTERKITENGLNNSSAKIVPAQSVILSCRAPIGHVFINEVEMSFNQGCKGLVPSDKILTDYLYYFLYSSKKLLNDLGAGTTFKEISVKKLANVSLPLPQVKEQKDIVSKFKQMDTQIKKINDINDISKINFDSLKSSILFQELRKKHVA